ncbi:hypothetical protein B0H67DRAFT_237006 [Lasiosphaeris hirsuta]|uniref:NADP-dependent oxidoreductase domain-containing protein n=1 Tax=Lasiosphaeris hirsuta TaxID=260670 RepID=A0AA40AG99_9PEZI|nr:hypothetical protein B0H67DRAFT_237006 [Lasiosphaeris hirsuta]
MALRAGSALPNIPINGGADVRLGFGTGTRWSKRGDPNISRPLVETIKTAVWMGFAHIDCADGSTSSTIPSHSSRPKAECLARSIGVSNFCPVGLEPIFQTCSRWQSMAWQGPRTSCASSLDKGILVTTTTPSEDRLKEYLRVCDFKSTRVDQREIDRLGAQLLLEAF